MARTIIRTRYGDNDLDKRITKLSKYFNDVKRESNEQGVFVRTKDAISAYLKSRLDGNANNEHNDYVNDYIRKICEKARENMEASSKGTYNKPYSARRFDYSKSVFLQTMCNEVDFFKEDGQSKETDKYDMFNYQQEQPTLFEENRVYLLKHESLDGSEQQEKTYLLVKYIHDIFGIVLDCLVVKQLSGNNEKIFTLTKSDCALLEIEYQSGLQILPSQLNWEQVKKKTK